MFLLEKVRQARRILQIHRQKRKSPSCSAQRKSWQKLKIHVFCPENCQARRVRAFFDSKLVVPAVLPALVRLYLLSLCP